MTEPIREYEGTWEEIAAHADELAGRRVRLVVLDDGKTEANGSTDFPAGSIEAKLMAMAAEIPEEEWAKLPPDLTDNLDHYIYGTPKK